MKINRLLPLLVLLCCSAPLKGVFSFCLLKNPDDNFVLILGDMHISETASLWDRFISYVQSVPLQRPLPITVEFDERGVEDVRRKKFDGIIAPMALKLMGAWDKPNDWVKLEFFDERKKCELLLATMGAFMEREIETKVSLEEITAFYSQHDLYSLDRGWSSLFKKSDKNKFMHNLKSSPETALSYEELLKALENEEQKVKTLVEKYEDKKEVHSLFSEELTSYVAAHQEIKKAFSDVSKTSKIALDMLNRFLHCVTVRDALVYYTWFQDMLCRETDYRVFNLLLIDKILIQTAISNRCYCMGENHAVKVAAFLEKLPGWKLVSKQKLGEKIDKFRMAWYKKFPDFESELISVAEQFLNPLLSRACFACNEEKPDMKMCVRCRKALYCSVACQKADWGKHKRVCNEIKVPVC